MIDNKSVLAIIPAREGSKRVPMKNLTLFRGRPLIQWAIDHATESKYIDSILISSDSDAILEYGKQKSPKGLSWHRRPEYLASDHASSEAVIVDVLSICEPLPELFVLLQPTSPLRTAQDIDTCIERAHAHSGACISYNEYGKRNGAVYVCRSSSFLSTLRLDNHPWGADLYTMPNSRSLDIDYLQDFNFQDDLKNAR